MKRGITVALSVLVAMVFMFGGCQKKAGEEQLFAQAKEAQEARNSLDAVKYYEQVVASFPTGERADEAQFMIGFLYANDICDTLKARQAYETFLERYAAVSDSGMVLSAKWELANLGRDVEEIEEIMGFVGEASEVENK